MGKKSAGQSGPKLGRLGSRVVCLNIAFTFAKLKVSLAVAAEWWGRLLPGKKKRCFSNFLLKLLRDVRWAAETLFLVVKREGKMKMKIKCSIGLTDDLFLKLKIRETLPATRIFSKKK